MIITVFIIQLIWEAHPTSSPTLPSFVDLFLVGSPRSGVISSSPRPYTETDAYCFIGLSSSLITVPSSNQPDNVEDESVSFSVWALLNDSVDGILLAKASEDGSTIYYGISVTADGDNYIIKFYYLPTTMNVSLIKKLLII